MKKIIISTTLITLLLNSALVQAAPSNELYADEIAMIARNEEIYTVTMQNKIIETTEINNVWLQIEEDAAELESFAEIKMNPLPEGIDDSTKQLYELTYESAYVENILARLLIIVPKIEAKTKKLEELLVDYDVAIKDQILEAAEFIHNELVNLQVDMNRRKQHVDSSLKVWSEWQKEIAIEAAAKDQVEVMNHLLVVNELGEIRNAFSIMKTNFLLALKKRDYEDAEGLIDGFRWLRTNSKLYFSDKISTQENHLSLQVILDDAEIQQEKMSEMLSRFAGHSLDGIGDSAKYLLMPKSPIHNVMMPGDGSGAVSGTVEGGNTSPTTGNGRREDSEGGGGNTSSNNGQRDGDSDLIFNWDRKEVAKRKSSEKTVVQYYSIEIGWNDIGIGVARVRDSKIAKTAPVTGGVQKIQEKKQKEIDELYKKEVLPQINEEMREQSAQQKPQRSEGEQSKKPPSLAKETNEARDFVNDARTESTNSNDREGLEKLAEKIKEYADTQKKYEKLLEDKVKEVAQTQVKSIQHAKDLSGRVKAPKAVTLNSPQGASAKDKLSKITQAIASFIMGIFSGTSGSSSASSATTIANFVKRSAKENPSRGSVYVTAALEKASGKPREIRPINDQVRDGVMGVARGFAAPGAKKIRYSKDQALRNGTVAFDCSGFVTHVYNSMGLDMRASNGRAMRVAEIVKSGLVYEVDKHDAKVGDLIVQFGDENGKDDDHIGIYSGKNAQGQFLYISSTTRHGLAKSDPPELNAIVEQRPEYLQKKWHVYRWGK